MKTRGRAIAIMCGAGEGLGSATTLLAHGGHGAVLPVHLHPFEAALLVVGVGLAASVGWKWLNSRIR